MQTLKKVKFMQEYCKITLKSRDHIKIPRQAKSGRVSTRQALEIVPCFADAYSTLGIILRDLGKLEQASTQEAIKLNPKSSVAYYNLVLYNLKLNM